MSVLWLILFILFALLEALTVQLVSIWFAVGSLGALLMSALGANVYFQIVVFIIISAALIPLTRPMVKKLLSKSDGKTDLDRIIGSKVKITADVDNGDGVGECIINGVTWSVRSEDGNGIKSGEYAVVKRIEGVKLFVERVSE